MGRRSKHFSSRLANLKGNQNKAQTRNEDRVEEGAEVLPEQHADTPAPAPAAEPDTAESSAGPTAAPGAQPAAAAGTEVVPPVVGRRIVDIGSLTTGIDALMAHATDCWKPSFAGERRQGLEVFLHYQCHKCGAEFDVAKQKDAALNSQAVYAAVTTGSGFSAMEAQMALLDIPFMTFKHFSELEDGVGEVSSFFLFVLLF